MHGTVNNAITCADPGPCVQAGTTTVVLDGVPLEFCERHADREVIPAIEAMESAVPVI